MTYPMWAAAFFGGAAFTGWAIGGRSVDRLPRIVAWPLATAGVMSMLASFAYLALDLA